MSKKNRLIPPLTFRLYQSIRFNRPIDTERDYISPGGYELEMETEDGERKAVRFDFEDSEWSIDEQNPCILHCMQKNPDLAEFEDLKTMTEHMLRHVTDVLDWYVYVETEYGDSLIPVAATGIAFEIISDSTGKNIPITKIPMPLPVGPAQLGSSIPEVSNIVPEDLTVAAPETDLTKELQKLHKTKVQHSGCLKTFCGKVDKDTFFSVPGLVVNTIGYYEDGNGAWIVFVTDSERGADLERYRYKTEKEAVRCLLELIK